jgi:hypothetical protein
MYFKNILSLFSSDGKFKLSDQVIKIFDITNINPEEIFAIRIKYGGKLGFFIIEFKSKKNLIILEYPYKDTMNMYFNRRYIYL